ncbi:unnamed protein product, partial [Arctogadus glacialis]
DVNAPPQDVNAPPLDVNAPPLDVNAPPLDVNAPPQDDRRLLLLPVFPVSRTGDSCCSQCSQCLGQETPAAPSVPKAGVMDEGQSGTTGPGRLLKPLLPHSPRTPACDRLKLDMDPCLPRPPPLPSLGVSVVEEGSRVPCHVSDCGRGYANFFGFCSSTRIASR